MAGFGDFGPGDIPRVEGSLIFRTAGETTREIQVSDGFCMDMTEHRLTCCGPKALVLWQRLALTGRIARIKVDQDSGGLE